jgi:glycolate oxidase FAD binding subunit
MAQPLPVVQRWIDQIQTAAAQRSQIAIQGGGTKKFYGSTRVGDQVIKTTELQGIRSYEPSELVITVMCGTPLAEVEAALHEKGQWLPFEPPCFSSDTDASAQTTLGGMVAAGLSGPGRATWGSVSDYVLGAQMLNGHGQLLGFGGQVIKNVAGYDISRLLVGSLGSLGVIIEMSLKVMPVPVDTLTLQFDLAAMAAVEQINRWAGQPLPLSASAWIQGRLWVRLSGARAAVKAAAQALGGQAVDEDQALRFWQSLRHQTHPFFQTPEQPQHALWRLSVPATSPPLSFTATPDTVIEWGGAQRWVYADARDQSLREWAARHGGHATLWRLPVDSADGLLQLPRFTPRSAALARIQGHVQEAFDPCGIFVVRS